MCGTSFNCPCHTVISATHGPLPCGSRQVSDGRVAATPAVHRGGAASKGPKCECSECTGYGQDRSRVFPKCDDHAQNSSNVHTRRLNEWMTNARSHPSFVVRRQISLFQLSEALIPVNRGQDLWTQGIPCGGVSGSQLLPSDRPILKHPLAQAQSPNGPLSRVHQHVHHVDRRIVAVQPEHGWLR